MTFRFAALDPAQQRKLKLRPKARRHLHRFVAVAFAIADGFLGSTWRQVEQQQGALGQQGFTTRRAQIIQ